MKKLFLLLSLAGMFATACEEGGANEPTNDKPIENPDDGKDETVRPIIIIDEEGNYIVGADGGIVFVKVTTDLEYDVVIPDEATSWISLADRVAVELYLYVAKNEDSVERTAVVNLCSKEGDILQDIPIKQDKSPSVTCANNEIIYTTKNGYPIELNSADGFGGNIVSHTYETVMEESFLTMM